MSPAANALLERPPPHARGSGSARRGWPVWEARARDASIRRQKEIARHVAPEMFHNVPLAGRIVGFPSSPSCTAGICYGMPGHGGVCLVGVSTALLFGACKMKVPIWCQNPRRHFSALLLGSTSAWRWRCGTTARHGEAACFRCPHPAATFTCWQSSPRRPQLRDGSCPCARGGAQCGAVPACVPCLEVGPWCFRSTCEGECPCTPATQPAPTIQPHRPEAVVLDFAPCLRSTAPLTKGTRSDFCCATPSCGHAVVRPLQWPFFGQADMRRQAGFDLFRAAVGVRTSAIGRREGAWRAYGHVRRAGGSALCRRSGSRPSFGGGKRRCGNDMSWGKRRDSIDW